MDKYSVDRALLKYITIGIFLMFSSFKLVLGNIIEHSFNNDLQGFYLFYNDDQHMDDEELINFIKCKPEFHEKKYLSRNSINPPPDSTDEKKRNRKRVNALIYDLSGQTHEGQILYVNDSVLYLYQSKRIYDKDSLKILSKSFSSEEIKSITLQRKSLAGMGVWKGGLWGLLPGFIGAVVVIGSGWYFPVAIIIDLFTVPGGMITGAIIGYNSKVDVNLIIDGDREKFKSQLAEIEKYVLLHDLPPVGSE